MEIPRFTELLPGLPEELGLLCLIPLPFTTHRVASRVCRRWRELFESREFYYLRKRLGHTQKVGCFVQSLPGIVVADGPKPGGSPVYGITVFDPVSGAWERVDPVPKYTNGLPLFCQVCGTEGKLVVMGGWDPVSYEPVKDVFVYDFTTCRWRQAEDMPSKRSFFAIGAFEGRIYVAGGHDENKNALKSAWTYDMISDEWRELSPMSQERDECEGLMMGNQFWVVSGYRTERQGMFECSAEWYDAETGEWRRVEGAWAAGRCPRSCVWVGKDGKLVNGGEWGSAVRLGACGVGTVVTGAAQPGAAQGLFYRVEMKGGEVDKLEKIDVDAEFCGFVQSGCCVEI